MPAPSSSLATLRPDLADSFTEFDLDQNIRGFVWEQLLPVFDAAKASGNFGRIPVEQLLQRRNTLRSPGSGYATGNWTFLPESYTTQEYGAVEPVDDNERQLYKDYFDAEQVSALRARSALLSETEIRLITALLNTSTFSNAAASVAWSTWATAKPIEDVEAAVNAVYDACGLWPDTMGMSYKTFRNLRNCDQILDRISASGAGDKIKATDVTTAQLAAVFDLKKIVVAGSSTNTAAEGQSAVFSQIWDRTKVFIGKTADSGDIREPCVGRTFHWSEDGSAVAGTVESYRNEDKRSDMIRVRHQIGEKFLYTQAGYIITGVQA